MAASPVLPHGSSRAQQALGGPDTLSQLPDHGVSSQIQTSEAPWQNDFSYPTNSMATNDAPAGPGVTKPSAISIKRKAFAKPVPASELLSQEPTPDVNSKDMEIARSMIEQERINEERERIKALQELDRKEAYIRERLESLK